MENTANFSLHLSFIEHYTNTSVLKTDKIRYCILLSTFFSTPLKSPKVFKSFIYCWEEIFKMRSIPFGCYKSKVGTFLLQKGILKFFSGKLSKLSFLKQPLIPAVLNRTAGIPQLSAVFLCSQIKVSFRKKNPSLVSLQEPILYSERAKRKSILSLQLELALP